jgi:4,5-DOPA dioxygenase extradiol
MTAYTLDLPCPGAGDGSTPAAELPADVPADGSNT